MIDNQNLKHILETLRTNLQELLLHQDHLHDPKIVEMSEQLHQVINQYQRSYIKEDTSRHP